MADILAQWKNELFGTDHSYENAIQNGFEGTEQEWYEHLSKWHKDPHIWRAKNNKLAWVTAADIDAMIDGTYEGSEDITSFTVDGETLIT